MQFSRRRWPVVAAALLALAACDDDPSRPVESFSLTACPTTADVNAPLNLQFSVPVNASTVDASAIVISSAETGLEIPGTVALGSDGTTVTFTPSSPFEFSQRVRVRVQNLRSAATNTQIAVTLCEFTTTPPPITQLYWRELPPAGGISLVGAALVDSTRGFVINRSGELFEGGRFEQDFFVRYQEPRFLAGFDIDFVSPTRGFATMSEFRRGRTVLIETNTAAVRFDSVASVIFDNVTRIHFRSTGPGANDLFNVLGGGGTFSTSFYKYHPATRTFTSQVFSTGQTDTTSGNVQDLDVAPNDTLRAAAVTAGVKVGTIDVKGWLYVSTNGGTSWRKVAGSQAPGRIQTYWGTAVRPNGDVFIAGGNGFFARVANPFAGTGAVTLDTSMTRVRVANADTTNPNALIFTDVQFAPDDPSVGWLIGAQLVGEIAGTPRYQGVIYETRDGGASWTRQGVLGAPNYGAEFPRLNRIEVRSKDSVWLVGDGGVVLRYVGAPAGTPPTTP